MPEYLAPGVFVEEMDSGSKPIEGVGVNTAAFIGYAKSGDYNTPTFISNYTQFVQTFGEEENAITLALCKELGLTVETIRSAKKASRKGWREFASDFLEQQKRTNPSIPNFRGLATKYNIPQDNLPYIDGSYLAHAVRGYYDNGGGRAYIIRVARPEDIEALSYSDNAAASVGSASTPAAIAKADAGPLLIKAAAPGAAGNDIKVAFEHVGDGGEFRMTVTQKDTKEEFPGRNKPALTLDTATSIASKLIQIERVATATAVRPDAKEFSLTDGADAASVPATIGSGQALTASSPFTNGLATLKANDFIGDEANRTGLGGLCAIEDVNFIAAPDLMAGVWKHEALPGGGVLERLDITPDREKAILDAQCQLVMHCERMGDRMAIIDPLPGKTPQQIRDVTNNTAYNCDHGQAAIYYPWIKISDPVRKGAQLFVPPSGHVAGVWARAASERGVHKAPANEALMGAVALEYYTSKGEQEILNPDGINAIRSFPGQGIRIWGARTLSTRSNPSWKYVNVRRLFNYIESSLDRGLQWVVFEPNDAELWGRVRRNVAAFLWTCWKEGMLFGSTPDMAFYVKCDDETNPQEMIDLGRLYCEIGVNPVKPAEFVIIRIGQWSSGGSVSEQ